MTIIKLKIPFTNQMMVVTRFNMGTRYIERSMLFPKTRSSGLRRQGIHGAWSDAWYIQAPQLDALSIQKNNLN